MPAPDGTLARAAFLVLLALLERPRHGLGIVRRIDESTKGQVRMGPGTLYATLQNLERAGHIRRTTQVPDPDDHDRRRRYYRLTPRGERALRQEADRLRILVHAASRTLGDA